MKENMVSKVRDKLARELANAKKCGRYAAAVMDSCARALEVFAAQDAEFADAILDGSLVECARAIEKGCSGKGAVSDLEVYRMAAQHFFPGAEVEFNMVVHVNPYGGAVVADKPTVNKRINLLDLI